MTTTDLPDVTITLPQNVWQEVENVLVEHVSGCTESDVEVERAIRALRGDDA